MPSPTPSGLVYVSNGGSTNEVLGFSESSNGNVAPIKAIVGSATGLYEPGPLAFDMSGNLYVANASPPNSSSGLSIEVFAPGSNGNVAPTRTIGGPNTGLNTQGYGSLTGIGLDASGELFVAAYVPSAGTIYVFAPNASGNVTPSRTINLPCSYTAGVAVSPSGSVAVVCSSGILTFAPGASGNATPATTISGSNTGFGPIAGLAFSPGSMLLAANDSGSILGYPATANGNVAPTLDISGTASQLNDPLAVATLTNGVIYVVNAPTSSPPYVTAYSASANGNASPQLTLSGSNTMLSSGSSFNVPPSGIAIGPP